MNYVAGPLNQNQHQKKSFALRQLKTFSKKMEENLF